MEEYTSLKSKAKTVFYINGFLTSFVVSSFVIILPMIVGLSAFFDEGDGFGLFIFAFSCILSPIFWILIPLWYGPAAYKNFGYMITPDGIEIKSGIIWKRRITIPFTRVQNVDILEGPIVRILGLVDLMIQTAGYSTNALSEGRIPALEPEIAEQLRQTILEKVRENKQGI